MSTAAAVLARLRTAGPPGMAGPPGTADDASSSPSLTVPPQVWHEALAAAHAEGLSWFDHLTAVDEPATGHITVMVHVASRDVARRLLVRTQVPRLKPVLPTLTDLWAGAAWPEREAHEMLGVDFTGHPGLTPLLLAPDAPVHPLRADLLLTARAQVPWPGRKDPADRRVGQDAPVRPGARRRLLPPGVPDPEAVP